MSPIQLFGTIWIIAGILIYILTFYPKKLKLKKAEIEANRGIAITCIIGGAALFFMRELIIVFGLSNNRF